MDKQEEIREGIANLTKDRFKQPSESAGLVWDENFNHYLADDILSYLHSQGVVIRKKSGWPKVTCIPNLAKDVPSIMAQCRFEFEGQLESLIKERDVEEGV